MCISKLLCNADINEPWWRLFLKYDQKKKANQMFASSQITFALLALNKFLQFLVELITTNKCNLWMHYSVSCPQDRAFLSWKDTPNDNSTGVKGISVTCTNTIHKNNLIKMCLLCTGLRTPDQWLLMELFSKPTLSCSCGTAVPGKSQPWASSLTLCHAASWSCLGPVWIK